MNRLAFARSPRAKVLAATALALLGVLWIFRGSNAANEGSLVPDQADVAPSEVANDTLPLPDARQPVRVGAVPDSALLAAVGTPGTISGIVLSPLGHPLPGATCSIIEADAPQGLSVARYPHGERGTVIVSARSNAKGLFELAAPDGYGTLQVEYDGLRTWIEESVPSGSWRRVNMTQERILIVHVIDKDSQPIGDAQLWLTEDPWVGLAAARDSAVTNTGGSAELSLQPGSRWFVAVMAPDHLSTYFPTPPFGDALRVERTVRLQRGIRIVGRVWNPRTGTPPPGAVVLIDGPSQDPMRTPAIDALGNFDSGAVFRRDYGLELTARAPGFAETRVVLDFKQSPPEEDSFTVELPLESVDARVTGHIQAGDSHPIEPVDLFVKPLGPGRYLDIAFSSSYAVQWRRYTTTDAQGDFKIEGLKPDYPYKLLAVPRTQFMSKLVRIPAIEAGTVHDLGVIELDEGASLTGRFLQSDGTPAVHLSLWAIMTPLEDARKPDFFPAIFSDPVDTYTNDNGEFEFAMLNTGGPYEFYWFGPDESSNLFAEFTPQPGEQLGPLEIVLPAETTVQHVLLRGVVQDLQGTPLGSVLVEAWNGPKTEIIGEGLLRGQLTDEAGTFELKIPANKELRLTATDLRGRFLEGTQEVVTTQTDEDIWFQLAPSGIKPKPLDGLVTSSAGAPLEGITVTLHMSPLFVQCSCLNWSDTTDAQGRFSFGEVAMGHHKIAAVDPTGGTEATMVLAEPGQPVTITMQRRTSPGG